MKTNTKILITAVVLAGAVLVGQVPRRAIKDTEQSPKQRGHDTAQTSFESLAAEEMHEQIIAHRDIAIAKAKERGDYRCCIHPPCTMCYMEANQWNNQTPGTCACDDLIAAGKEPCPQCVHGLCESETEDSCEANLL
jgi:hypothetical protein